MNKLLALPLMTLMITACVTINIYFPAAAAEEAARTIVRDVLQGDTEQRRDEPPAADDKASSLPPGTTGGLYLLGYLLESLVPTAHAADANIDIDTPAIRALRTSMQRRQGSLAAYYRSGAIGFDNAGNVTARDLAAVPLAERNRLKKLVAEENSDRQRLYREIAKANGHPEWESKVRSTFAAVWAQEAPAGYWYQGQDGRWLQR
jgi:uncharacterized protein YdbL (DUF1318 family)